jgi:hypothetical protein
MKRMEEKEFVRWAAEGIRNKEEGTTEEAVKGLCTG